MRPVWSIILGFIILMVLTGCSGGGGGDVSGVVVVISGPKSLAEYSSAEYSVDTGGVQVLDCIWAVDPPVYGSIAKSGPSSALFTAYGTPDSAIVTIRVIVTFQNAEPVHQSYTIVVSDTGAEDLVVKPVIGPDELDEKTSGAFSVDVSGDTGLTYKWSVFPAGSGVFSTPNQISTNFIPAGVSEDTGVRIWVEVNSDNAGPVFIYHEVTIRDIPGSNSPPIAAAEMEPSHVLKGAPVKFFDHSIDLDGESDLVKWEWDFSYRAIEGFRADSFDRNPSTFWWENGTYKIMLRVTDSAGNTDLLDAPLQIIVQPDYDALVWGGYDYDQATALCVDNGSFYCAGQFSESTDFDPGAGIYIINPGDTGYYGELSSLFVSKFNENAEHEWTSALTKQVDYAEIYAIDLDTDSDGNLYLLGLFTGSYDADPGPGEFVMQYDDYAGFIVKLSREGELISTTWWDGSNEWNSCRQLEIDVDSNVIVNGYYYTPFDADPGPEYVAIDEDPYSNYYRSCVIKLDSDLNYLWSESWGASSQNLGNCYSQGMDSGKSGNILIAGRFYGSIDFDPDPDSELIYYSLIFNSYLMKMDPSGALIWAKAWGGDSESGSFDVAADNSGFAYVTGNFVGKADFDPGPEDVYRDAEDGDLFLSKFSPNGDFIWVRNWLSDNSNYEASVGIGKDANILVGNQFNLPGSQEFYIRRYNSSGIPGGVWNWSDGDMFAMAAYGMGEVLVAGRFYYSLDFDNRELWEDIKESNSYYDCFLLRQPL